MDMIGGTGSGGRRRDFSTFEVQDRDLTPTRLTFFFRGAPDLAVVVDAANAGIGLETISVDNHTSNLERERSVALPARGGRLAS